MLSGAGLMPRLHVEGGGRLVSWSAICMYVCTYMARVNRNETMRMKMMDNKNERSYVGLQQACKKTWLLRLATGLCYAGGVIDFEKSCTQYVKPRLLTSASKDICFMMLQEDQRRIAMMLFCYDAHGIFADVDGEVLSWRRVDIDMVIHHLARLVCQSHFHR